MIVYRVETKREGRGPFCLGALMSMMLYEPGNDWSWPMPWEDGLESYPRGYRYGFHDWAHARSWFGHNEVIRHMRESNHADKLVLRVFDINRKHVVSGKSQCVFDHTKAREVGEFDLEALHTISEPVGLQLP